MNTMTQAFYELGREAAYYRRFYVDETFLKSMPQAWVDGYLNELECNA